MRRLICDEVDQSVGDDEGRYFLDDKKSHTGVPVAVGAVVTNIVGPMTISVYELMEFPVCTCFMYPPIHQCHNGHTLCSTCNVSVHNRCPTCRQEFRDIRCLALKKIVVYLAFFFSGGDRKEFKLRVTDKI